MIGQLWPHQLRAIEATREALRGGARAPLIVSPTGSGKTRLAVAICSGALERGNRVLWVAHRRELIEQAAEDLRRNGATELGLVQAGYASNPRHPIQVASIQTLLARGSETLPPAEIVVLDECHHYLSRDWNAIASHYTAAIRIGLTATPQRSDGTSLGNLFDALIPVASVRELTEAGFLVPCKVVRPDQRQGARTIAQRPVEAYLDYAPRTQAIVFCADVAEAKACAEDFSAAGVSGACVDGKMSAHDRTWVIDRFKAGRIRVLTNCFVLTEGFDHPAVETCILARGCGVVSAYLQMVGRVLRASPKKTSALLIDLSGAVLTHGLPDDDREWTLDGNGYRKSDAQPVVQCPVHGFSFRLGQRCPGCEESGTPQPVPVRISGDRLVEVDRSAPASDAEKQRYYEWLRCECIAKGFKPGWVHHRYVARFGEPYSGPVSQSTREALARVSRSLATERRAPLGVEDLWRTLGVQTGSQGGSL